MGDIDVGRMFIEIVKTQTSLSSEMRVRNELDKYRMKSEERRDIRQMRFMWGVLILCATVLGVKAAELLSVGVL